MLDRDIVALNQKLSGFLDLTRHRDEHYGPTDLAALIRDAARLAEPVVKRHGLGIELAIAEGLPRPSLQSGAIRDALLNLLVNAAQSGQGSGVIRVEAAATREGLRIRVEERGRGIEPNDLTRVFVPFFTTKVGGNGLIEGRTGTGKELVARALHGLGPRAQGPFVAVNCGAIPETMLEAELFGHEKGAFTGATRLHRGRFEQARAGTLFLDEIGEMPPASQVSLLRVLETGSVQRLGGERDIAVDVRVVAATHRPLEDRVESGLFRQDLLYRLNVLPLRLPTLRERAKDIGLLAERFLANGLRDMGWTGAAPMLDPEALSLLEHYHWPGNVRELRNLMARLAVRLPPGVREIGPKLLQPVLPRSAVDSRPPGDGVFVPKGTRLADAEWLLIEAALMDNGHNRARAAKVLGIGERALRRKLNGGCPVLHVIRIVEPKCGSAPTNPPSDPGHSGRFWGSEPVIK